MLVDEAKIKIKAGDGGSGGVFFNRIKMNLGPTGGNGGRGGNVFLRGVADLGALEPYRRKKEFAAEDGENGQAQFTDGKDGETLILTVPVGTVVQNLEDGSEEEIVKIDQEIMLAKGGQGGKGNFKFRSSRNTSPKEFQSGTDGEEKEIEFALKLIADVGFVGLPNVGKSTLLNLLTNAKSKVANYQFTTLEPNLGTYFELVLADIPGLIEGASDGKGLGDKFLRHVERTDTLFHFLACDSEDIEADYQTIRKELADFNPILSEKEEYLLLTKTDEVTPERLKELEKIAKSLNPRVIAISMYDDESLKPVQEVLAEIAAAKKSSKEVSAERKEG